MAENILGGEVINNVPLLGLKDVNPMTNLDKGDSNKVPLIGLRDTESQLNVYPGKVPSSYNRILKGSYHPEFGQQYELGRLDVNQDVFRSGINFIMGTPGTVAAGAVKGLGYLLSLPSTLTKEHEDAAGAKILELGKQLAEANDETFPIFTDPKNAKIDLFNPEYWYHNVKMIQEMAPIAIGATAIGGAVGAGVEAIAGAIPGVSALSAEFAGGSVGLLTKAGVDTHIFNMMFAATNYDEVYQSSLLRGMSEEDANRKASIAAAASYKRNWALAPLSLAQYAMWAKAFYKPLQQETSLALAKTLGTLDVSTVAGKASLAAKEGLIGATKLGWQWSMNEEGKYVAEKAFDPSLNIPLSDRANSYLKDGDFWSNVFFGGVAGGVMTGVMNMTKSLFKGDPQVNEVKKWASDLSRLQDMYKEAELRGDEAMKQQVLDQTITNMMVRGKHMGMGEQTIDWFKKIAKGEFTPEEAAKLGIDPEKMSTIKGVDIDKAVEKMRKVSEDFDTRYKEILEEGHPLNKVFKKLYEGRVKDYEKYKPSDYAKLWAGVLVDKENKVRDFEGYSADLERQLKEAEDKIPNFKLLSDNKQLQLKYETNIKAEEEHLKVMQNWADVKTNAHIAALKADALKKAKDEDEKQKVNDYFDLLHPELKDEYITIGLGKQIADVEAQLRKERASLDQLKSEYKQDFNKDNRANDKKVPFNIEDFYEYSRIKSLKTGVDSSLLGERNDLDRYRKGEISNELARSKYNQLFTDDDALDSDISESDYVRWTDEQGAYHPGKVIAIDGDNYTIQEIDENYRNVGEPVVKPLDVIELAEKIGNVDIDRINVEPISDADESPEIRFQKELATSGVNKALAYLFGSLSTSHIEGGKIIQRDKALFEHTADPKNQLKGSSAKYEIDWDNKFWEEGGKERRLFRDKARAGALTSEEINKFLSTLPENVNNFSAEAVDKVPIKVTITADGQVFDKGLYVHDSDFWNVRMPVGLETADITPEEFVAQRRQESRAGRRQMLTSLLSGNEVTTTGLKKLSGHYNTVATNGNVHQRLGVKPGELKVLVGTVSSLGIGKIQSNELDAEYHDGVSKGAVYVWTNKSSNGEPVLVKLNPSKLSREHAEMLYDAIVLAKAKGYKAPMEGYEGIEGLNAGEVINLLALYGRNTNPNHPNNKNMDPNLRSKALYIGFEKDSEGRPMTILNYGANKIELNKEFIDQAQEEREREHFVQWAMENKNYRIPIGNKEMGLKLNEVYDKKFKLGSFTNDPADGHTFATRLMETQIGRNKDKSPLYILSTNIDRVKRSDGTYIESVTHSPVIDLNNSHLSVRSITPKEVAETKAPKVPMATEITKQEDVVANSHVEALKQLPIGTEIWFEDGEGNKKHLATINKTGRSFHMSLAKSFRAEADRPNWDLNLTKMNQERITKRFNDIMSVNKRIFFERPNEPRVTEKKPIEPPKKISTDRIIKEIEDRRSESIDEIRSEVTGTKGERWWTIIRDENGKQSKLGLFDTKENLLSEINKIYDRELPKVEDVKSEVIVPEVKPAETKSPIIEGINSLDDMMALGAESVPKEKYKTTKDYKQLSETELNWLKSKLGPQNVKVVDKLIEIAGNKGKKYFGAFQTDAITIWNAAPGEVLYHEAFHRVSLGYLSDFERKWVYDTARRRYGLEGASESIVEEYLADRFMDYKVAQENGRELPRRSVMQYIIDLYDFVKSIFTGESQLRSFDIDKLFDSIERGKFRYSRIREANLERLHGKQIGYEISDKDIPTIKSIHDMNSLVKRLSDVLLRENHINNFNDVIKIGSGFMKPMFDYISHEQIIDPETGKGKIDEKTGKPDRGGVLQQFRSVEASIDSQLRRTDLDQPTIDKLNNQLEQVRHYISLYESILDPQYAPIFVNRIHTALRSYNIRIKERDGEAVLEEPDMYLANIGKASYEFDTKDTVLASIKFLIATLPQSDKVNPMTFTLDSVDFNEMWHSLLFDLYDKDNINDILDKLDSKSDIYSYKILAKKLREGDDLLRAQFKVAMNKQKHMYVNFSFKLNDQGKPSFQMSKSDIFSASTIERVSWSDTLYNTDLVNKTDKPKLDKDRVMDVYKEYNKFSIPFNKEYKAKGESLTPEEIDSALTSLIPHLNKVGIDVDRATLDEVVNKLALQNKITKSQALNYLIVDRIENGIFKRLSDEASSNKTPIMKIFSDESLVKSLAETKYEVHPDLLNDSTLGPAGNQYFTYAQNTYMSDVARQLAKNPDFVMSKLEKVYNGNSDFLSQLLDEAVRKEFGLLTQSGFIQQESGDPGRDYLSLNSMEDYLLKMSAFDKGVIPIPTMGDKGMYHFMRGLKAIDFDLSWDKDGNIVIPDKVVDLFFRYAADEENRIKVATEFRNKYKAANKSEKKRLLADAYINYHYVQRGDNPPDFSAGNAYKHLLFPSFDAKKDFKFDTDAKDIIRQVLKDKVNESLKHAESLKLISGRLMEDGRFRPDSNIRLDAEIIEKGIQNHGSEQHAIENAIARHTIRTIQSSIEFGKIFVGDPAFKKFDAKKGDLNVDYTKRLNGALSTGDVENNESPEYGVTGKNYNVATMNTQEIDLKTMFEEDIYNNILKAHLEDAVKQFSKEVGGEGLLEAKPEEQLEILKDKFHYNINEMLSPYRNIDSTDGQAWISPEMYRSLSIRVGEWSPEKNAAFKLLQSDKELTREEYIQSLNIVMQPLKVISYGLMDDSNLSVPIMDKMSVATIFRQMGHFGSEGKKRIEILDLLDRMEGKGKYEGKDPIHMVKMSTAVKSGGKAGFNLYGEDGTINDLSDIEINQQPYSLIRKQLNTDPHEQIRIKVGTQSMKVGLSNIDLSDTAEATYDNPRSSKKTNGRSIVDNIVNSTTALSNKGRLRLEKKLGIKPDGTIDRTALVKALKNASIQSGTADLIADAFRMGPDGKMYLELDAFPNRKQVFSGLISMFAKEMIDTKLPGGQMIQFSNRGIRYNESDELKFTKAGEDGMNSMECYVSINMFKDIIPDYENLSWKRKRDFVLDHADEIMGYRIPTQAQASVWNLKVKDVYPETIGDVITLPAAFTRLTGSDFDIDKVYVIRNNYNIKDGVATKIKFYETPEEAWDGDYAPKYEWIHERFKYLDDVEKKGRVPKNLMKTIENLSKMIDEDIMDQDMKDGLIYMMNVNAELGEFDAESYHRLKAAVGESVEAKKIEYLKKNEGKTPYEFNSSRAVENLLIDSYKSVYKSLSHIRGTTTPLGSNNETLKKLARDIHDYDDIKDVTKDLSLHTPQHQSEVKFDYTSGKDGLAPFALNNVHHALSQIAGLKLRAESGGLLHEDADRNIDVSRIYGKDNVLITNWLSSLIDIHVDNAKDPVVSWLNLNPTTWDTASLLIRGGLGLDSFKFLAQPILKEYANFATNSDKSSKIKMFNDEGKILEFLKTKYLNQLKEIDKANEVPEDKQGIVRVTSFKELMDGDRMMNNIKHQHDKPTAESISRQLQYLDTFINLSKTGKKLNNLVQASQIDTKKFGNTITSMIEFRDRVEEALKSNDYINVDKLLGPGSFLGGYYKNFFVDGLKNMSDLTIYSTPVFNQMLDQIRKITKAEYAGDKTLSDKIADELMGAIYAKFFFDKDMMDLKPGHIGVITKYLTDTLHKIKTATEGPYKDLADNNAVIRMLNKYPVEDITDKLPFDTFLSIPNKNLSDKFSADALMYSMRDLLRSDDPEIRKFARNLFVYSFFTSGFKSRLFSFYNYFPPEVMKELNMGDGVTPLSMNDYITRVKSLMSDPDNLPMFSHLIDEVIINNWSNSKIVPMATGRDIESSISRIGDKAVDSPTAFVSKKYNQKVGENSFGQPIYTKYLTTYVQGRGKQLLRYIGYIEEEYYKGHITEQDISNLREQWRKEGLSELEIQRRAPIKQKKTFAVYKVVPKKSFERGGLILKEYGLEKSSIESNNVRFIPDGEEYTTLSPILKNFTPVTDFDIKTDKEYTKINALTGLKVEEPKVEVAPEQQKFKWVPPVEEVKDIKDLPNIPVNYMDGSRSVDGVTIKTINGKSNIQNELDGIRQETTRSSKQFKKPKIGDLEVHTSKNEGIRLLVRVTTDPYTPNREDFNKYEGYTDNPWDRHSDKFTKDWFSYRFEVVGEYDKDGNLIEKSKPTVVEPPKELLEKVYSDPEVIDDETPEERAARLELEGPDEPDEETWKRWYREADEAEARGNAILSAAESGEGDMAGAEEAFWDKGPRERPTEKIELTDEDIKRLNDEFKDELAFKKSETLYQPEQIIARIPYVKSMNEMIDLLLGYKGRVINPKLYYGEIYIGKSDHPTKPFLNREYADDLVNKVNAVYPNLLYLNDKKELSAEKGRYVGTIIINESSLNNYIKNGRPLFERTPGWQRLKMERNDRKEIANAFNINDGIIDPYQYVTNLKDNMKDLSEDHTHMIDVITRMQKYLPNLRIEQINSSDIGEILGQPGLENEYRDRVAIHYKGNIYLFTDRLIKESKSFYVGTVIHEMIHGFTSSTLYKYTRALEEKSLHNLSKEEVEFATTLQRIYDETKNIKKIKDEYAFTDIHEFIAEALTSQKMIDELKSHVDTKAKLSLWQRIKMAIAKFFGMDYHPDSYHGQLLTSFMDYVYKGRQISTGAETIQAAKLADNIHVNLDNLKHKQIIDILEQSIDQYHKLGVKYRGVTGIMDENRLGGLPYDKWSDDKKAEMKKYADIGTVTHFHIEKNFANVTKALESEYKLSPKAVADIERIFKPFNKPGVTILSEVELPDHVNKIIGKADLIVIDENDKIHIFDYKTKTGGFDTFDVDFNPKRGEEQYIPFSSYKRAQVQLTGYKNIFEKILTKLNVDVESLNVIPLKPIINETTKLIESYELDKSFDGKNVIKLPPHMMAVIFDENMTKTMDPKDFQDTLTEPEIEELSQDFRERTQTTLKKLEETRTPEQEILIGAIKALERRIRVSGKMDKTASDSFKSQLKVLNNLINEDLSTHAQLSYVVKEAEKICVGAKLELDKKRKSGVPLTHADLYKLKEAVSAFDILDDYETLLNDKYGIYVDATDKSEKARKLRALKATLNSAIKNKNLVKFAYQSEGLNILAEKILPMFTKVKGEFRRKYEREYNALKRNLEKGDVTEADLNRLGIEKEIWAELKKNFDPKLSQLDYINTKMDANGDTINERSRIVLLKELKKAGRDIGTMARWMDNVLDSPDAVVGVLAKEFVLKDDLAYKEIEAKRLELLPIIEEFEKATGKYGNNYMKALDFMIEKDLKTGKLTGHYVTRIHSELRNQLRNISAIADMIFAEDDIRKYKFISAWKDQYMPEDKEAKDRAFLEYIGQLEKDKEITTQEWDRLQANVRLKNSKMVDKIQKEEGVLSDKAVDLVQLWYKKNSLTFRNPIDEWVNPQWTALQNLRKSNPDDIRIKYYDAYEALRQASDDMVPTTVKLETRFPGVIKDNYERQATGQSLMGTLKNSLSKQLTFRVDDTHRVNTDIQDSEGNARYFVPVHYTGRITKTVKDKEGNEWQEFDPEEQSFNLLGNAFHYYASAVDFHWKNEILPEMEMARYLLNNRDVVKRDALGNVKVFASKLLGGHKDLTEQTIKGGNIAQQFDTWLLFALYGQGQKDLGVIPGTNIDIGKLSNALQRFTALNLLGINWIAGISNVALGETLQIVESFAEQNWGKKEYAKAIGYYTKNLPGIMGDIASRRPTNIVSLLLKEFNVLHDPKVNNLTESAFREFMRTNALFFTNHAGEHSMQTKALLASLERRRAYNSKGEDIGSILDLYKVNKEGKLEIDKSTGFDEVKSKWDENGRGLFEHKVRRDLSRIHGEYSDLGRVALQNNALGSMAIMFRKFVVPGFRRRWGREEYYEGVEDFQEGNYTSTIKFTRQLIRNLGEAKSMMMSKEWALADDMVKANIIRSVGEAISLVTVTILAGAAISLAKNAKEDDDSEFELKMLNLMAYQMLRLKSELLFFVSPNAAMQILRSPAASIAPIQNFIKLSTQLFGPGWHEYEQGPWKDHFKITKTMIDMSIGMKQFYRLRNLADQVNMMQSNVIRSQ